MSKRFQVTPQSEFRNTGLKIDRLGRGKRLAAGILLDLGKVVTVVDWRISVDGIALKNADYFRLGLSLRWVKGQRFASLAQAVLTPTGGLEPPKSVWGNSAGAYKFSMAFLCPFHRSLVYRCNRSEPQTAKAIQPVEAKLELCDPHLSRQGLSPSSLA